MVSYIQEEAGCLEWLERLARWNIAENKPCFGTLPVKDDLALDASISVWEDVIDIQGT